MSITITKKYLNFAKTKTHALLFSPEKTTDKGSLAVFAHGYTSHKGSILPWASRLAEEGVPTIIFDWPGHYLGNYSEVECFDDFENEGPKLFQRAFEELKNQHPIDVKTLILGGHSLGALMSLKALPLFQQYNTYNLCVGFGFPPKEVNHIFDTPFYKSTLNLRGQLVSPAIGTDIMFPWIKGQKKNLQITGKKIYLLSGEDDVVVGKEGADIFLEILQESGNQVILEKPKKLPHHQPENAAPHIKKFLKDQGLL